MSEEYEVMAIETNEPIQEQNNDMNESAIEKNLIVEKENTGRLFGISKKLTALGVVAPAEVSAIVALVPDEYKAQAMAYAVILTGAYIACQTVVDIIKELRK